MVWARSVLPVPCFGSTGILTSAVQTKSICGSSSDTDVHASCIPSTGSKHVECHDDEDSHQINAELIPMQSCERYLPRLNYVRMLTASVDGADAALCPNSECCM